MKRNLSLALCLSAGLLLAQLTARAADSGKPTTAPAPVVEVQADGSLLLKAEGARIHGTKLHLDKKSEPTLIFWVDNQEYPEWPHAAKKGNYSVEITYSCAPKAGGDFIVFAAANKLAAKAEQTADWKTFKTVKLGNLTVLNDNTTVSVQSPNHIERALINIRSIKLTPIAAPDKDKK